jgi:Protein of unknown function (DUF3987)
MPPASTDRKPTSPKLLKALADAKRLPLEFLRECGLREEGGAIVIPYHDAAGGLVLEKRRLGLKAATSRNPARVKMIPFGRDRLAKVQETYRRAGKQGVLFLAEGETDALTFWFHVLPALGIPGAEHAGKLDAEDVEEIGILYVCHDNDKGAGDRFVTAIGTRLEKIHYAGRAYDLRWPDGIKDPSELHVADPLAFQAALDKCVQSSVPINLNVRGDAWEPQANGHGKNGTHPAHKQPAQAHKPRTVIARYKAFPLELLPEPAGEYVKQGAKALGCDPAYLALPVLSVLASVIGNTRSIRLKGPTHHLHSRPRQGWEEPSVIWTVTIGQSGTLKSPAFDKIIGYLESRQLKFNSFYRCEWDEYQSKLEDHRQGEAGKPAAPILKRLICSDITLEKLAPMLEENPRGLLMAREELAGWLGGFTRYKTGGASDRPSWLSMHGARAIFSDRKTGDRQTIMVERAAVSVAGTIQPQTIMRQLSADDFDSGLVARLLAAMPPNRNKRWSELVVDPDTEALYEGLLNRLMGLQFNRGDERDGPYALPLSAAAKKRFVKFYDDWGIIQESTDGDLAAAFSKIEGYAPRFALVHHVATHAGLNTDDLCEVSERSMRAGIDLALWFADETRRVYAALAETDEQRSTRQLVEFLRARGGAITVKDLQRSNDRKYPSSTHAELALERLVSEGLGSWHERPSTAKGGRPTRDFSLLEAPDETDETSPAGEKRW